MNSWIAQLGTIRLECRSFSMAYLSAENYLLAYKLLRRKYRIERTRGYYRFTDSAGRTLVVLKRQS